MGQSDVDLLDNCPLECVTVAYSFFGYGPLECVTVGVASPLIHLIIFNYVSVISA